MKSSSLTDVADLSTEQILVGVILGPHGIRGEVAVAVHSDNSQRFVPGATLNAAAPAGRGGRTLRVERSSPHKGGLRIAFAGVTDRRAAEALRGLELSVPRAILPAAKAGAYYLFELVGCVCVDERDGELGTVVEVVANGGGWLLEVERKEGTGGRRLLLPFVEEFLRGVDPAAKRIEWRLPEGLVEACASRF